MKKNIKYDRVGRPSNEEVQKLKKKKILKIVGILLSVFGVVGLCFIYYYSDEVLLSGLLGDSTAKNRIMTFVDTNENAGYVVRCTAGYRLKYKKNSGAVKNRGYYCQKKSNNKIKDPVIMRVPYFTQNDYKNTSSRCGGGTLNYKGCLPTVGAMTFSALLGEKITPIDMNNAAYNYGYSSICSSNSYTASFIDKYAASKGVKVYSKYLTNNKTKNNILKKEILDLLKMEKKGKCIGIVALEKSYSCVGNVKSDLCYSNVGHFVMFYSVGGRLFDSNNVYVNDPALKNGRTIAHKKYNLLDLIESGQGNKVRILCKK